MVQQLTAKLQIQVTYIADLYLIVVKFANFFKTVVINCCTIGLVQLGPRPGNMSQNGQKPTSLMTSLTKNDNPQNLFSLQTRRLAKSFEGLNSSPAQSAEELCCWQGNLKLRVLGQFPTTNISYPGTERVKNSRFDHVLPIKMCK